MPAFVFVAITGPLIPRLRSSQIAARTLDGVNVTSLALMAGVTLQLGRAAIIGPVSASISVLALLLLVSFKVNPVWLVLGGGAAGLL